MSVLESDTLKKSIRSVKNIVGGYTDIQIKVRKATSNDSSPPPASLLQEIAASTYNSIDSVQIIDMLEKRLNDSGKNWRHVYKALVVLDYLIHCGSENVVQYFKDNIHYVKTLKEFQFVNDNNRDLGLNVRNKVVDVLALLNDSQRLKDERGSTTPRVRRSSAPSGGDQELELALEESKRTAALEEKKRKLAFKSEHELQMVLELSANEYKEFLFLT